ncbi:MAG TPA: helix-turn-helix transcriptional regulator [Spirochaetota bacterium]|nr:helix-turn-helix transcriptional regulator [Spirochaetota bacterium]HPH01680.1 helix-turn-helix transcriptional regulator [Spirochaetota bacterium]HPN82532.1 helix-turn-helix transcriptional regulator [Spirochaetota bacterium]
MTVKTIYDADYRKILIQLKRAREERGLSQMEAARLLNMTQSTLSKCENGDRRIDIIELTRFAAAYEKDMEYLLPENIRNILLPKIDHR